MIWTCCITCLGQLEALCHLVRRTEPTLRSSTDNLCDLTLDKLRNRPYEVYIEEQSHCDIFTLVRVMVVLFWMGKALTEDVN